MKGEKINVCHINDVESIIFCKHNFHTLDVVRLDSKVDKANLIQFVVAYDCIDYSRR